MNVIIPKKDKRLKFAIYVRQSKYKEESESIGTQIKMCKNYIFSHFPNVTNEDIFIFDKDEGFSGKNTKRKDFQKMMEGIKNKDFNYVICYKLDRISRSINDFSSLIIELESRKIEFISVKENFDTTTPMGRAMMYLTAVFAQMERETLAERVKDSLMYLASKGRKLGKTPTGFNSYEEEKIVVDGKVKVSHYLKENEYSEIIKTIFQKFLEFGSGYIVAKYLLENGIKKPNGTPFFGTGIERILKNPVYCTADRDSFEYFKNKGSDIYFDKKDFCKRLGIAAFNKNDWTAKTVNHESKWVIALGKHPGLISGKDWVAVQNIFDKRASRPHTSPKYSLLSGLIECANCGRNMRCTRETRPDRTPVHRYVCSTKIQLGADKCTMPNLHGSKTEEKVIDYIMNFDENKLKKDLNIKKYSRKVNTFEDKTQDLEFQILQFEKEKDKYIDYLKKITPTSPLLKDIEYKVLKINNKIEKLEEQKQINKKRFNLASEEKFDIERVLKNLANFKKNFYDLDFEHKKSLLRLVLIKLTWNGNELVIFLNGEKH